jgi:hypothetical protein
MSVVFTAELMREAVAILDKYHKAIAVALYGRDALTEADWKTAVGLGLVDPKGAPNTLAQQVYNFGVMLAHMDQAERQSRYGASGDAWLAELRRNPVPMTTAEESASKYARQRAAQFVTGLGSRAAAAVSTAILAEDARLTSGLRDAMRAAVAANMGDSEAQQKLKELGTDAGLSDDFYDNAFRGTTKRLRSDLGHLTQMWERDLERIARTETTEMWNHGQTDEWTRMAEDAAKQSGAPPRAVYVYRVPTPTACSSCFRLYTTSTGPGGDIRIFELSSLEANGTNYGAKRADWKPIIGATHPYCVCDIQRLPTYVTLPKGWSNGQAAPSVVGSDGLLVLPE